MTSTNTPDPSITLEEKVQALQQRETYPVDPSGIEARETHMSWVFLTEELVYKMKKPVEYERLNFSTQERRKFYVREEVRLNRRLAPGVYLGPIPLTLQSDGSLRIDGSGTPVEWLVKMRRLPEDRMLDHIIENDCVDEKAVEQAAHHLTEFYRESPPIELSASEYCERFTDLLEYSHERLENFQQWITTDAVREIWDQQHIFLETRLSLLEARAREARIIEAHGDLRPEHICLNSPPVIYDCLEFSRHLRVLDPIDELAYLTLECELLGDPDVAQIFWEVYEKTTDDRVPDLLVSFYASVRSCQRAELVLRHLEDREVENPGHWIQRANHYLSLGQRTANNLGDAV